jgi:hypothetical protein
VERYLVALLVHQVISSGVNHILSFTIPRVGAPAIVACVGDDLGLLPVIGSALAAC